MSFVLNRTFLAPRNRLSSSSFQSHHPKVTKRSISSILHKSIIDKTPGQKTPQLKQDIDYAICKVRKHDPAGFLPGFFLPPDGRAGYFAIRAFWVETGLRNTPIPIPSHQIQNTFTNRNTFQNVTPEERIQFWRNGINSLYRDKTDALQENDVSCIECHPVLRLLQYILNRHDLSHQHFREVLDGRERDLHVKQYLTMDAFVQHSQQSCGNLLNLTLECLDIYNTRDSESFNNHYTINNSAHKAALDIGTCHGLTNGLRTAIPLVSNTGKIIIPQELCHKYDVRSPRYLLSALGQGDAKCRNAFRYAVKDIATEARKYLERARKERQFILEQSNGERAIASLLPGLTSETFLNRLELEEYNLTSKNLRQVGPLEHFLCATRVMRAWKNVKY